VKSQSTLSSWRSRDSVPYAICVDIAEERGINLYWLLTGQGNMRQIEKHAGKILELYDSLSDNQRKEILSVIEEKKRFNQLIEIVENLQAKVG
jgi:hypothetical protein